MEFWDYLGIFGISLGFLGSFMNFSDFWEFIWISYIFLIILGFLRSLSDFLDFHWNFGIFGNFFGISWIFRIFLLGFSDRYAENQ